METEVRATLVADASTFTSGMRKAAQSSKELEDQLQKTNDTFQRFSTLIGIVTTAAAFFGRAAFRAATEVDELNITMIAVGKSTGLGSDAIETAAQQIQGMGIEMAEARRTAIQFAQQGLNIHEAWKLASVAQDLAVVSSSNSTETMQRLVRGVMTGNSIILRGAGITTQAGEAYERYAAELGVATGSLNAMQRQQALINAILEEGTRVAGAYEKSMDNAGKVLRSMPRIMENIRVAFGMTMLNGLNPLVLAVYKMNEAFQASVNTLPKTNRETGEVTTTVGGLVNAMRALATVFTAILSPITNATKSVTDWLKSVQMSEEQALAFANKLAPMVPVILGVASALSAASAAAFLKFIPGMSALGGLISPLLVGFIAIAATSSEVQAAFGQIWTAVQPLLPVLAQLAQVFLAAAMAVGTTLIPIIADLAVILIEALSPLINWFATSEVGARVLMGLGIAFLIAKTGLGQFIAAAAVSAFATLRALWGSLVAVGASAIGAGGAFRGMKTAQDFAAGSSLLLSGALRGLGVAIRGALAATGFGLLIVGLSILAEAFIRGWQTSQSFRDKVVDAINVVIGAFEKLANAAISTLNFFLPKSMEVTKVEFGRMARSVISDADDMAGAFGQFTELMDFLDRGMSEEDLARIAELEASLNGIDNAAGGAAGSVSRLADQLKRIEKAAYDFGRWVLDVVDMRNPMVKALDEVAYQVQKFDGVMANANSTADELVQGFSEMASTIRQQLGQGLAYARQELAKAQQAYDEFYNTIKQSITGIINFGSALQSGSGLVAAFESLRDSVASVLAGMLEFRALATAPVRTQFVGFVKALGDALGVLGEKVEESFLGRLRQRRDQIAEFGEAIQSLAEMGISEAALRQITGSGYEAGLSMARELIAGGKDAIAEVNTLTDDVMAVINTLSTSVAEEFYSAGGVTGSEFIDGLMEQADQATAFAEKIRTLIEMGLEPAAIRQVLAAGFEAGGKIADELIAGGSTVIDKVNTMLAATERVADEVAKVGASKFFQAGIDAGQALVDGMMAALKTNESRINSVLLQLAAKLRALEAQNAAAAEAAAGKGIVDSGAGSTFNPFTYDFAAEGGGSRPMERMTAAERNARDIRAGMRAQAEARANYGRSLGNRQIAPGVTQGEFNIVMNNNIYQDVDADRVATQLDWTIRQALR